MALSDSITPAPFALIEQEIARAVDGEMIGGIFTGYIAIKVDYWERTYIVAWQNEHECGTHQANVNSKGECALYMGHGRLSDRDAVSDMAERANLSPGRI
jgi:hypothetical protein